MKELFETCERPERFVLLGVSAEDTEGLKESLDELAELIRTAGGEAVGRVVQNREKIHPATYFGRGKLEEVKEALGDLEADGVVCDDELSPAQMRNLEEILGAKIMDRTMVILDIFAARATTSEGKIQVELAQLRYRAARLVGLRASLSRLGGGIGTRGPGEKKLEVDRRLIHDRISQLKSELDEVVRHRDLLRGQRKKSRLPTAAVVGYTNAGKSTLLNALTGADLTAADRLFETLDPATRALVLANGQELLLSDTVGFIRKLPHHLIDAFKSTLEEARYCDILIHVVDCANPDCERQMHVVYETLRQLDVTDKTIVTVFNKVDLMDADRTIRDPGADFTLRISAKTGEGLAELKDTLLAILRSRRVYLEKIFPYAQTGRVQEIRRYGELISEEYTESGILVKAYVPAGLFSGYMT